MGVKGEVGDIAPQALVSKPSKSVNVPSVNPDIACVWVICLEMGKSDGLVDKLGRIQDDTVSLLGTRRATKRKAEGLQAQERRMREEN
jgi:hypothetical protein